MAPGGFGLRFAVVSSITRLMQLAPLSSGAWLAGRLLLREAAWLGLGWQLTLLLDVWMVIEALFLVYQIVQRRRIQRRTRYNVVDQNARRTAFMRAIEVAENDIDGFLSPWFYGAKVEEIYRENLEEWLAWAFFSSDISELAADELTEIAHQVDVIESKLGRSLMPGRNAAVTSIRLAFDPVNIRYRPFVVYAAVHVTRLAVLAYLRSIGFRTFTAGEVSYHVWKPSPPMPDEGMPFVFVHGIGVGVLPYVPLILAVRRRMLEGSISPSAIFLTEMPYVSMALSPRPAPQPAQVVRDYETMIRRYGYARAVFAGHSLGTTHVAWIVKQRPHLVAGALFVDPIVFLLCRADIAFNFLYRRPVQWNEEFINYFASSEMGVALTLRRHFCWISNSLWPENVVVPTVVALSGMDGIVPSAHVDKYLRSINTAAPLSVLYMKEMRHAGFLGSPQYMNALLAHIRGLMMSDANDKASLMTERSMSLPFLA